MKKKCNFVGLVLLGLSVPVMIMSCSSKSTSSNDNPLTLTIIPESGFTLRNKSNKTIFAAECPAAKFNFSANRPQYRNCKNNAYNYNADETIEITTSSSSGASGSYTGIKVTSNESFQQVGICTFSETRDSLPLPAIFDVPIISDCGSGNVSLPPHGLIGLDLEGSNVESLYPLLCLQAGDNVEVTVTCRLGNETYVKKDTYNCNTKCDYLSPP